MLMVSEHGPDFNWHSLEDVIEFANSQGYPYVRKENKIIYQVNEKTSFTVVAEQVTPDKKIKMDFRKYLIKVAEKLLSNSKIWLDYSGEQITQLLKDGLITNASPEIAEVERAVCQRAVTFAGKFWHPIRNEIFKRLEPENHFVAISLKDYTFSVNYF
jgi:hypothetical protein